MGKKKKKKGTKPFSQRLAEQLKKGERGDLAAPAGHEGLAAEQYNEHFDAALKLVDGADPRQVIKLPIPFQVAFCILAEQEEDDDQLNDLLAMTTHKQVKKEAKRILHRMRSRGMDVSVSEESGSSILDRKMETADPDLVCHLTPLASNGSRMIWLARYVHGGVAVYQAEVNDEAGLAEFSGGVIGRSRYRMISKEIKGTEEVPLLDISYSEAKQRLANAVAISRAASKALPEGYLEASSNLPESDEVSIADPRSYFDKGELDKTPELVKEAAGLQDIPEFSDWFPDEETLKTLQAKIQEIESSQLTINKQQKVDQVKKALEGAVEDLLGSPERIKLYQNRLFEMAAQLFLTDKKDEAKLAAAAAWQLEAEDFTPLQSPFFDRLVNKMFRDPEEIVEQMSEKEKEKEAPEEPPKDPGNLIMPP